MQMRSEEVLSDRGIIREGVSVKTIFFEHNTPL